MKKLIAILLSILLLITVSSCSREEIVDSAIDTSEESLIDLNLSTFGEVYNLSNDEVLSNIMLIPRLTPIKRHALTQEQFDKFYNILLKLQFKNSTKENVSKTKNGPDFTVKFSIKKDGQYSNYDIILGESYLLVTLIGKDDYINKHEINEVDYINIKSILDSIANNKENLLEENEFFADDYEYEDMICILDSDATSSGTTSIVNRITKDGGKLYVSIDNYDMNHLEISYEIREVDDYNSLVKTETLSLGGNIIEVPGNKVLGFKLSGKDLEKMKVPFGSNVVLRLENEHGKVIDDFSINILLEE